MQLNTFVLITLITLMSCQNLQKDIANAFNTFIGQNNVKYSDQQEYNRLFEIYKENSNAIKNFKAGSYHLTLNKFAIITKAEFKQRYLTLNINQVRKLYDISENSADNNNNTDLTVYGTENDDQPNLKAAPANFDWRNNGAVTGVKDQGQCGCCWAFASIGAIEGAYAIKNKKRVQFSEQQLLDCDNGNSGCNGGSYATAINYVKNAGGVATLSSYPYKAQKSSCSYNGSAGAKVSGYTLIGKNENDMKDALYKYGPLATALDSSGLQFYGGGIYTCSGNVTLNHGVLIVGYGEDGNGSYWIIKNSWGSSWGMNGYMYLKRGTNECGIASYVVAANLA
jgi:C1A family cysteine protease